MPESITFKAKHRLVRSIALRMSNAGAAEVATSPETSRPAVSPPAVDVALADRAVGAWRRINGLFKAAEAKLEKARDKVLQMILNAGVAEIATKHGVIKIRTKSTTDWEALARRLLSAEVVDGMKAEFTKESKPYIQALPSWGSAK